MVRKNSNSDSDSSDDENLELNISDTDDNNSDSPNELGDNDDSDSPNDDNSNITTEMNTDDTNKVNDTNNTNDVNDTNENNINLKNVRKSKRISKKRKEIEKKFDEYIKEMESKKPKKDEEKKDEENNKPNKKKPPPLLLPKKPSTIFIDITDLIDNSDILNILEPPKKKPRRHSYGNSYDEYNNYCEHPETYNNNKEEEEQENYIIGKEYLDIKIENNDDLIKIGKKYLNGEFSPHIQYNINVYKLSKLVEPLEELNKMIGMEEVKRDIFELLLYQLQDFDNSKDMLHTIIEGEPGVGKTDLAKIMGKIYRSMGYCYNDIIKFVKRSDLIGGYLGQTAIKTQKVLDECKGGILIIDEAYSLGNPEGRDSYSKECIDTLTSFLSESPETIVFIMGYKEALEECLFNQNKGLERRFTYRFSVNKYSAQDLKKILFKIVRENGWDIENEEDIPDSFFIENRDYFPFNGGDMLNLFTKCKFTHSIRFFNINRKSTEENNCDDKKRKINFIDINNAFKLLMKDEKFAKRNQNLDKKNFYMYT